MPRDLRSLAKEDTLQGLPELTKSPDEVEGSSNSSSDNSIPTATMDASDEDEMLNTLARDQTVGGNGNGNNDKRDQLHPYTQTLSVSDIESCNRLEEETFPPNERCSMEKVSLGPVFRGFANVFLCSSVFSGTGVLL